LRSLRLVDAGHKALIRGPVGVEKILTATARGHVAVRRRDSVVVQDADVLTKKLRASSTTATTPTTRQGVHLS
jgi:hypothetical protein